jgi:hypothetical protein
MGINQMDERYHDKNINTLDDWYSITTSNIKENGGETLLARFGDSLPKLLTTLYLQHNWQVWKFKTLPNRFWDDEDNVIMFMDWLCSQLQVIHPFDWYNISNEVIERHGAGLLLKYGGKYNLLASVYPHYHWDVNKFHISSQKTQHHLHNIVQNMFPSYKVLINSKPAELQSHHSGARMEVWLLQFSYLSKLDVYIPLLSLAFEYQVFTYGSHLYIQGQNHFGNMFAQQRNDQDKRSICDDLGITLIEIPFWWDLSSKRLTYNYLTLQSLEAKIRALRPDLIVSNHVWQFSIQYCHSLWAIASCYLA